MSIDNDLFVSAAGGAAETSVAAGVPRHGDRIGETLVVPALRRGSTGWVYLARNLKNNTPVAVGILSPECSGDTDLIFREKARKHAVLDHPNILRVHKLGTWEKGRPYAAMEYVDGPSLSELLLRHGKFPPSVAVAVAIQLCRALQEVWKVNVDCESMEHPSNHRVPMPEDMVFTSAGELKLSLLGPGRERCITTCVDQGYIPAVHAYMSPEQHETGSRPIDHRSDIYSMGVLLFEMITGTRPFPEESVGSMIRAKKREEYPDLHQRIQGIPASLRTLIEHTLKSDPEKRWQRFGALAMALSASLRNMTECSPVQVVGEYIRATAKGTENASRRTNGIFFSGSLAAIIALLFLVALLFVVRGFTNRDDTVGTTNPSGRTEQREWKQNNSVGRTAYLSKPLFQRLTNASAALEASQWEMVVTELDPAVRYAAPGVMRDRAIMMLLEARVELSDTDEAERLLQTETGVDDAHWFLNAGRAYDLMGRFLAARESFTRAISASSVFGREVEERAWLRRAEFLENRLDVSDTALRRIVENAWRDYLANVCAGHPNGGPRCEHAYTFSGAQ